MHQKVEGNGRQTLCASLLLDGDICFRLRVCVCGWGVPSRVWEGGITKASFLMMTMEVRQGCPCDVDSGEWCMQAQQDPWSVRAALNGQLLLPDPHISWRKSIRVSMCDEGFCTVCCPTEKLRGRLLRSTLASPNGCGCFLKWLFSTTDLFKEYTVLFLSKTLLLLSSYKSFKVLPHYCLKKGSGFSIHSHDKYYGTLIMSQTMYWGWDKMVMKTRSLPPGNRNLARDRNWTEILMCCVKCSGKGS